MVTKVLMSRAEMMFWLFVATLTLLVIHNAFYAHPMADDYCFVEKVFSHNNWIDTVVNEYKTWGGRYATTALISIFIQHFDLVQDFWLVSLFLILLSLFSMYFFFSAFQYLGCANRDWRLWLAFSWCFYLATQSAMPEVLYWLSGGVTYAGGYSFLLISAGLLLRLSYVDFSPPSFIVVALAAVMFVVLTPGFNEVAATLQVVFLLFGVFFARRASNKIRLVWLVCSMLGIAALAISAMAPGNFTRMSALEGHGIKWLTPFYGLYEGLGVLLASMILMYLVTSNSLIYPVVRRLSLGWSVKIVHMSKWEKYAAVLFAIALFSAVFMPSYWAEGGSPAKRTETILFILPVLIWIPYIAFIDAHPRMRRLNYPWLGNHKVVSNIFSGAVIVLVLLSLNVKDIVLDTFGRAVAYDDQLQSRYSMIDVARKEGKLGLVVPALTVMPKTLYFGDILTDASHWRNTCYASYFKLKSIKLKSENTDS